MHYKIVIPNDIVARSFDIALEYPKKTRGNFFNDIRKAFQEQVELVFESQGISVKSDTPLGDVNLIKNANFFELEPFKKFSGYKNDIPVEIDAKFCARYGHTDYSLEAINYLDRAFPSVEPFKKIKNFSLGNIAILVGNQDYHVTLQTEEGIKLTGYTYNISKKKRKSYICLLGIHFTQGLIADIIKNDGINCCNHPIEKLDEIRIQNSFFPATFICRKCGVILTCSCFEEYLNIKNGLTVQDVYMEVKQNICHLCTGDIPSQEYLCSPTPSVFLKRYMPYHYLFSLRKYQTFIFSMQKEYKEIENEVRVAFNYPKIGEKWISETLLYKMTQILFPDIEIIHHYRGRELEGLEIDIWIPSLKIGIEYQGIQHFTAIQHWGGQEALEKRIQNDKRKKQLCKLLDYKLIEFNYDETLSEEKLSSKINAILQKTV
ncbi:MAG: hypothetical protein Fur0042_30320 [Cyanophyceae cyanobacterium]